MSFGCSSSASSESTYPLNIKLSLNGKPLQGEVGLIPDAQAGKKSGKSIGGVTVDGNFSKSKSEGLSPGPHQMIVAVYDSSQNLEQIFKQRAEVVEGSQLPPVPYLGYFACKVDIKNDANEYSFDLDKKDLTKDPPL
jgi:hypothetical protein